MNVIGKHVFPSKSLAVKMENQFSNENHNVQWFFQNKIMISLKKTFLFSKTVFALIGLAEYFEKTEDSFLKLYIWKKEPSSIFLPVAFILKLFFIINSNIIKVLKK